MQSILCVEELIV